MILFLPETSRNIVGNGSLEPPRILKTPVPFFGHWEGKDGNLAARRQKWALPNPLKSLTILVRRDNAVIISAAGLLYVIYTCINASLSTILIDIYNINQWQAGLVYLPFGLGGVASTFFSGPLMDRAYRRSRQSHGLTTDKVRGDDLDAFDIEKARLSVIWVPMLLTSASVIAYGWVVHYHQVSHNSMLKSVVQC